MNFLAFKNKWFDLACFSTDQVYAWQAGFDRNNFSRWHSKGYIIRLRQGWYTFPEYLDKPDFAWYFAGRMYRPSTISLHSALSFYGLIPESVVQITSVTPLKTNVFSNPFGEYAYKSIKPELMFGFDLKPVAGGRSFHIATPEKALLDLLYLYPAYNSAWEIKNLRLDEDFLHYEINLDLLNEYTARFKSRVLEARVKKLVRAYEL